MGLSKKIHSTKPMHCSLSTEFFSLRVFCSLYLSNRKRFRVCIAWYKHERGRKNSRQSCKPETNSRVPVENSLSIRRFWGKRGKMETKSPLPHPLRKAWYSGYVENSPNPSSVNIRLCKRRKKVFYCFYDVTFPRKTQNSLLWHWLKEKFLPVAKSCARSLARVISSCFAKRCQSKYGFFSLKLSA